VEKQLSFEELLAKLGPLSSANKSEQELAELNAQLKPWLRELHGDVAYFTRVFQQRKWDSPEILLWWAEQTLGKDSGLGFLDKAHRIGGEPLIQGNLVCTLTYIH
jgi:hypothetical protein